MAIQVRVVLIRAPRAEGLYGRLTRRTLITVQGAVTPDPATPVTSSITWSVCSPEVMSKWIDSSMRCSEALFRLRWAIDQDIEKPGRLN